MSQSPLDFLNLLVRPPGDLLFFLAVIMLGQAGFFIALERWLRVRVDRGAARYTWAGLGVVLVWALLMIGALVALLSGPDARLILPPLERLVQVLTVLLVGWAFLTADHDRFQRSSNIVLLAVIALVVSIYILTGSQWPELAQQADFNLSQPGVIWTVLMAAASLAGLILLLIGFRLVPDAPLKLVFFMVLLAGSSGALAQIAQGSVIGDYSGITRLAFVAALPVFPAVIYRMVVAHLQAEVVQAAAAQPIAPRPEPSVPTPVSPLERESVQLLKALGLMLEDATPTDIPEQVIRAILDVLKADVGLLLHWQDANYADVIIGFDAVMDRKITALAINLDDQPTLVNAVERETQRPLYVDRNIDELQDLYTRLDIGPVGPAYFQPLIHDRRLIAVLVVALPYTGRELTDAERELLKGVVIIAAGLLSLSNQAKEARLRAEERVIEAMIQGVPLDTVDDAAVLAARQEMQASLELAREQIEALTGQVTQLKRELDQERSAVASSLEDTHEGLSISQQMLALSEEQSRLQGERDALQVRLQEAETALAGATASTNTDVYNSMVEMLRREKADLEAQKETLQSELDAIRRGDGVPQDIQHVLAGMSESRARLEVERDQLRDRLGRIEGQLTALGIENGPAGLARVVADMHEQRATVEARYESVKRERDALLSERARLEEQLAREKARDERIEALETEITNLAADREALVKHRDRLRAERDELQVAHDALKRERDHLRAETSREAQPRDEAAQRELAEQLNAMSSQIFRLEAEKRALESERDQYLARLEGDRDRVQEIGSNGVGSLTRIIEELSKQRDELETEVRDTRIAADALRDRAEMLQIRLEGVENQMSRQPNDPALIMGMVEELRTPLTSIMGYVELLLSESAGILGEMQRGFLQRVASNINRLTAMINDLTRITALDTGSVTLDPQPVDLISIIEDVITETGAQLREKGHVVHLNLDDDAPLLPGDHDALTQVVGQLLTNAYLVTPVDGEIFISARQDEIALADDDEPRAMLHVTIEDRGGGIAPDDEAHVFSRRYRAENPLIVGLGDTGVGLAIARALIEAQGGRLWLESKVGVGTAFHFALPLEVVADAA